MFIDLEQLNSASLSEAVQILDGLYEHSPWVAERAMQHRPFRSWAQLKHRMSEVVRDASLQAHMTLVRAYPELKSPTQCTQEELNQIEALNQAYNQKFGWPFILAAGGPRGSGLNTHQIIETFRRRLQGHPDVELQECLRNIHRIAEVRLNHKTGYLPTLGHRVWDWQEALAQHSDAGYKEKGQLTVTYLTEAHLACCASIRHTMTSAGFDEVFVDAVGNVVGRYHPRENGAKYLLTGSHYDTVRNGGKHDGRLGIFVPIACVQQLFEQQKRLNVGIEVVAFAEEEGQRYKATFLGSGALLGQFNSDWLHQVDADGISMKDAMKSAGLDVNDIPSIQRSPENYAGFVEVHIEQGPVLNEMNLPLGVVTSINGSVRYLCEMVGVACHAGTTPMNRRRDAVNAVAELALFMEQRAVADGDSVATIGQLHVPNGSINVVPGRCVFSLDLRAPNDVQRDALERDVLQAIRSICERRGLACQTERTLCVPAAPSAIEWQQRWENALHHLGLPVFAMPSGAGHDAMKLHEIMPQAMLFVRGENGGISHNPLESTTSDDMQLAAEAFAHLLRQLDLEAAP
jgi:N-carbamoyl-L-amino-acid hydrolase